MEATRNGLASLCAINQFENRILLSGVGAVHGYDITNDEHYPTPGLFYVDHKLKRQMRAGGLIRPVAKIQRLAGWAWGSGETDNIAFAMAHITKKMKALDEPLLLEHVVKKNPKNNHMPSVLLYGGAFCPVHFGHLNVARRVQRHMHYDHFLFMPCKEPVLDKTATASAHDRVAMLTQALLPYPHFSVDLSEIERSTPSFMVDTLRDFRGKRGVYAPITLLIGMDSVLQLPRWHRWEELLKLAHLLVIDRPGIEMPCAEPLKTWLAQHQTRNKNELLTTPFGKIYRFNAGQYDISSTGIREAIKQGRNTSRLIPAGVRRYIDENTLFRS